MNKTKSILEKDGQAILGAIGAKDLPEKDKSEVVDAVLDHMNKVVIETVILNLDEKQVEEFGAAVKKRDFEEEVTRICAQIPGLAQKIESAIEREFLVLRAAKEKMGA